jgi:hypothetical protein
VVAAAGARVAPVLRAEPRTLYPLDAVGWANPVGRIDRKLEPVVSVTVVFTTTESAVTGTGMSPPTGKPPTVTSRLLPIPHGLI